MTKILLLLAEILGTLSLIVLAMFYDHTPAAVLLAAVYIARAIDRDGGAA